MCVWQVPNAAIFVVSANESGGKYKRTPATRMSSSAQSIAEKKKKFKKKTLAMYRLGDSEVEKKGGCTYKRKAGQLKELDQKQQLWQ